MRTIEDQLREALRDMADEVQLVPLLQRLEESREPTLLTSWRERRVSLTLVGALAAAAAVTLAVVLQPWQPHAIEPAERPPQQFQLSLESSPRPGPASLAVVLNEHSVAPSVQLLTADRGGTAGVSDVEGADWAVQRLSYDGTKLLRMPHSGSAVVLDLTTGKSVELEAADGPMGELSRDGGTLAAYVSPDQVDWEIVLVDVASGRATTLHRIAPDPFMSGLTAGSTPGMVGWAPDDSKLAFTDREDLVVVDRQGTVLARESGVHLENGSQGWSPDGKSLLVYDLRASTFGIQPVEGGDATPVTGPPGAVRPLGWSGERIVWLVGQPGSQELITTDQGGADAQPWCRLDVGDEPVENVMWSKALSG